MGRMSGFGQTEARAQTRTGESEAERHEGAGACPFYIRQTALRLALSEGALSIDETICMAKAYADFLKGDLP